MNSYAISPVSPSNVRGSDFAANVFTFEWTEDFPLDGEYIFRGLCDNNAQLYVDDLKVADLAGFNAAVTPIKKTITKGIHNIRVDLLNAPIYETTTQTNSSLIDVTFSVYGQGKNTDKINFSFTSEDGSHSFVIKGVKQNKENRNDVIKVKPNTNYNVVASTSKPQTTAEQGLIQNGTKNKEGATGSSNRIFADHLDSSNDNDDMQITSSLGSFTSTSKKRTSSGRTTFDLSYSISGQGTGGASSSGEIKSGTTKGGVTYEGPTLFAYKDKRWGDFMNNHSVSPVIPGNVSSTRMRSTWKGVSFPESGQYDITFLSDSGGILFIGGKEVLRAQQFAENPQTFKVNITQGIYDVVVDNDYPYSSEGPNTIKYFRDINPTGFALVISKNVILRNTQTTPWSQNPVGISAVLIPPPCPRRIRGRGVVTDVIVNDPGNGYLVPIPQDQGYPVTLRLKEVIVENPGINYRSTDRFNNIPNGAILEPVFGPFGTVQEVKVLNPGLGFVEYPEIRLISETGVNASFRPVFEVVRDPIVLPEKLIQVTDLVGLKQTGYVNGRPYYGAVYYDQGVRFAGFYETVGEPVRVYDTLQESITAEVTTPPNAIQRQGTDVTSNDPRLNIPNTPENLI